MRNYECAACPYCQKVIRKTKPMLLCMRERYAHFGGHPIAYIKKCPYDKEVKGQSDEAKETI